MAPDDHASAIIHGYGRERANDDYTIPSGCFAVMRIRTSPHYSVTLLWGHMCFQGLIIAQAFMKIQLTVWTLCLLNIFLERHDHFLLVLTL